MRDLHTKQDFDLLTVPEGALETENGSVFDPGGDGNGEDHRILACVKPDISLRTLGSVIDCEGKIVDMEIGSMGNEAGRACCGSPEDLPLPSKYPLESSPSASKCREKTLLKGIAPGIEGGRAERKISGEGIAAQIVLILLVPVAQNVVGLVDFLETLLGLGIVAVRVRMMLKGQFPVCDLNFALVGVSCDPKNSVVVFSLHRMIGTRFEWA